jgi:hypothetical protein
MDISILHFRPGASTKTRLSNRLEGIVVHDRHTPHHATNANTLACILQVAPHAFSVNTKSTVMRTLWHLEQAGFVSLRWSTQTMRCDCRKRSGKITRYDDTPQRFAL